LLQTQFADQQPDQDQAAPDCLISADRPPIELKLKSLAKGVCLLFQTEL
jgi:hypothetical protein